MKHNFSKKLLAFLLCIAMLLNSSSVAFATDKNFVGSAPAVTTSETVAKDEKTASEGSIETAPPTDEPTVSPEPTATPCGCSVAEGGETVHIEGCLINIAPVLSSAITDTYALFDTLPDMDELSAITQEDFKAYFTQLESKVKNCRAAYDALSDEDKAAFDTVRLEKLASLEEDVAATAMLMLAEGVPVLTEANGVFSYQNVVYSLNADGTSNAAVCGVISTSDVTGDNNVLTIPTRVQQANGAVYNVTEINTNAFEGCENITEIIVPSSIIKIGDAAFNSIKDNAVITLQHTSLPLGDGIKCDSFITMHRNFIKASPDIAKEIGETYVKDTSYGIFVSEVPVAAFNRANGSLRLSNSLDSSGSSYGYGGYNLLGINGGIEFSTTFMYSGYETYLSTDSAPSFSNSSRVRVGGEGSLTYVKDGIWVKASSEFVSGGAGLKITYTLHNSTGADINNVSLGVFGDTMIGRDDRASIYPTATGFRLVNDYKTNYPNNPNADPAQDMQFTLNCTNSLGADDVSTMWYGKWNQACKSNIFTNLNDKKAFTGLDSALAFSWRGINVPANGSATRSVVFGIGVAATPPALPADPAQKPIALYLTASGQKDITVNAKVSDTAGVADTLYYTINDGAEQILGESVIADGSEQVIAGNISASNFADDGEYTVKLWIMNNKGAMSEVITKVLTISGSSVSGEGIETGEAPVPTESKCSCIAPVVPNVWENKTDNNSTFPSLFSFSATGGAVGGSCAITNHADAVVNFTYTQVSTTSGQNATVAPKEGDASQTVLTFPAAGTYVIKCVASANGKETAQNATFTLSTGAPKITIKINGEDAEYGGTSLSDAVTKALGSFAVTAVKTLKITAGEVTAVDWKYFAGGTPGTSESLFKYMENFEIDTSVTKVDNIPNGGDGKSIFPASIKTVIIPQKTAVGDYAFQNCSELLTASLPEATAIGANAFYYCSKLATISLNKVMSMGNSAFNGCTSLVSISLSKITEIGVAAFNGCTQLATLKLPKNPPSAGSYAFNSCSAENPLILMGENGTPLSGADLVTAQENYDKVDDKMADSTTTDGKWYGWKVREPVVAVKITIMVNGGEAVDGTSLSNAVANSGMTASTINTLKITQGEVTAKDWIYFVGGTPGTSKSPFTTLKTFEVDTAVTSVADIPDGAKSAKSMIFPTTITSVTIPQSFQIGKYAFYKCKVLENAIIPNVTAVGEGAFYECEKLTSISLPKVTKLFHSTFYWCTSLDSVQLKELETIEGKSSSGAFYGCKKLESISLPKVTTLPNSTFSLCETLKSLDAPNLQTIEDKAFLATGFTEISLPQVTIIGTEAFSRCAALEKFTAPNLIIIGSKMFRDCFNLAEVNTEAVKTIGSSAFENCKNLTFPNFPNVKTIESSAFYGCTLFTHVALPKAETLNGSVFNVCDNLVSASLPALKTITGKPFGTNANLTKLFLPATPPTVAENPFKSSGTIYFVNSQGDTLLGDALKTAHDNYKADNDGNITDATWYKWVLGAPEASWEASDGSKGIDTLYNAIKTAAKLGGKVKLLDNYEYENLELRFTTAGSGSDIRLEEDVMLDLAGYTINSTSKYTTPIVFDYENAVPNGVFSIIDSSEKKTGTIMASQGYIVIAGIDALPLKLKGGTYISGANHSKAIHYENQKQNEAQLLAELNEVLPNGYKFDPDKITVDMDTFRAATEQSVKVVALVAVTGVRLNKIDTSLEVGKSETLTATVAPTNANNNAVSWKTSNPAVATVDKNGKVMAVAAGSATITVTTTDGGKTATCTVTVMAAPAPGGKLEALLTQDKVDDVFGKGNATLDSTSVPPKITLDNSITSETPIEIETDVTIDLGGNTITGKPGQPGLIVGDGNKVTIGGGGTIAGGDNSSGVGGNGINGGTGSEITIDKGTTVEGGNGVTGGDGINSNGDVIVDGTVNGGDGSSGNGGNGVDTSGSTGNITIKPDGSATGGNSTGGNGNGGNGTSSGGNTTVEGDVIGGNGNGSDSGGNGANGTGSGNSNIEINNGGSASGGNGGDNGGAGGDGINNNFGDVTVSDGGTATGGNGGNGTTGGAGGDGIDSGTSTVENGGKAEGGNGGDGTNTGGNGGDGSNSSGKGEIDGSVIGGNGGNGGITGGNGGDGAASGIGSNAGDIDIGGSASGGNGGSGTTTGGTGGDGAITGGDIKVETNGSASGGSGGSSSTDKGNGGNGGNGANTTNGGTTVNGDTSGGNGGNGTGNGNGGNGGNGVNQGEGTVGGNGTATGGNGGNGEGTGNGGSGGSGVGGGANPGSVTTKNGVNGRKSIADVDDSKSGTTVKVTDESKLIDAALTEAEKQDPTISEVKVVLNVEKKNNQPDKPAVDKALSMVTADTIGAFFDITLDKIITTASGVQPPVVVANASEEIEITITIPSDMRGGSDYVVIRVHNGTGAALATTQSGDNLTFKTDKFSIYAIAYSKAGGTTPPIPPITDDSNASQTCYYIKATAGVGGSINTPERVKVLPGESAGFTIIPNKGYQIADVIINGKSIGAKNYYAFTNVLSDQTIHAIFKKAGHLNPQTDMSVYDNIQ